MTNDKPKQAPREWPGNLIACSGDNLKMHDELCDFLEAQRYSEADVVTASVGIWAGMQVMKEHLESAYDSALAEKDAEIARLREALEEIATNCIDAKERMIASEALSQTAAKAKGEGK